MERIVVGIDETPAAADAVRFAVDEGEHRGWPVTAVLCWSYPGRHGEGPLEPAADGVRPPSPALDHLLRDALGDRAGAVTERVDEVDFAVAGLLHHVDAGDLLVVGQASRRLTDGLLRGSITQRCLHDSPCPVAVVHQRPAAAAGAPTHVVIGVDGSVPARAALRWGLAEARARTVPAQVVHAWEVPIIAGRVLVDPRDPIHRSRAQAALDGIIADLPPEAEGVEVVPVLAEGPAADVLLDRSDAGDLVVVGTRGISGVAGILLGSTAARVSQLAPNPVVVVPAG